ncbi:MAG: hypothetical protein RRB22_03740 [Gammaproteobacteria bacterium]|nr:hypothetical protein [Gammaproteobacteria bacterium]
MSSDRGSKGRWARAWVLITGALLLTACATVNKQHPLVLEGVVTEAQMAEVARVYFIRPKPYKSKGVSDARVRISFQNETLLTQAEGNYSLLYIRPAMGLLKVHSETMFTDQAVPVEVWRAREYKFIAGKTYFVYVRQLNEEFRGVFYEPQPVSLAEAQQLIQPGDGFVGGTLATGAARSAPIDRLTEVDAPPASAVKELLPALPENIYKQEKYLYKVR